MPFQYNRGYDAGKGCRDKRHDASQPYAVRLKMPEASEAWLEEGAIAWTDLIKGHLAFPADTLDDWIIARTGEGNEIGVPTYNFCVVVDDTSMEVSHVLRGRRPRLQHPQADRPLPRHGLRAARVRPRAHDPRQGRRQAQQAPRRHQHHRIPADGLPAFRRAARPGAALLDTQGGRPGPGDRRGRAAHATSR